MRKIFNAPLLSIICVMLTIGFVSSCNKNDTINSGMVQLFSFGPTGAMHGDTIRFIGNNLDKVTAINLTGAVVPKTAFISQSSEVITIKVPKEAEKGYVTLKTPSGDIVTKTKLDLMVPVTITAIPKEVRPGDNLTITGNYVNWITSIRFGKDKVVDTFVSKSLTQLVVKVPVDAQTGSLIFSTGGTEPLVIAMDTNLVVTLPSITSFTPNPIDRDGNLTITGTNLDLTKGVLFKGMTAPTTVFVSKSPTQLVVKVPTAANKGKISLVAYSGVAVESAQGLTFVGDLPDLAALKYAMYVDKLENNWQNWGWGSTTDFANTENVRDGTASIKQDYTGQWGALKFANGSVSTASYNEITFSIFGTPGTAGLKLNVAANGGTPYTITIEEGKWVEYKLSKANLGNPATITDLVFQNQAWTGKLYIDHVGLR